ncbi:putative Endonuclease 4 [Paratrimastix pyriformis]|uniref:Endonuclease 4 n=1 Tax=Paratrimastix pyriformis TaxID=342808 RepID=A0ABQ8UDG4_9EUKA|nr:putative Endonuclease 4 [Paratrimastix pyriformis]
MSRLFIGWEWEEDHECVYISSTVTFKIGSSVPSLETDTRCLPRRASDPLQIPPGNAYFPRRSAFSPKKVSLRKKLPKPVRKVLRVFLKYLKVIIYGNIGSLVAGAVIILIWFFISSLPWINEHAFDTRDPPLVYFSPLTLTIVHSWNTFIVTSSPVVFALILYDCRRIAWLIVIFFLANALVPFVTYGVLYAFGFYWWFYRLTMLGYFMALAGTFCECFIIKRTLKLPFAFIGSFLLEFFSLILVFLAISYLIIPFYASMSTDWGRMIFRLLAYPIIVEFSLVCGRIAANLYPRVDYPRNLHNVNFMVQIFTQICGRFLLVTFSSQGMAILATVFNIGLETLTRLTLAWRDRWIVTIFTCGRGKDFWTRKPYAAQVRSDSNLTRLIAVSGSVLATPFLQIFFYPKRAFFQMNFAPGDPEPSLVELVQSALIRWGIEILGSFFSMTVAGIVAHCKCKSCGKQTSKVYAMSPPPAKEREREMDMLADKDKDKDAKDKEDKELGPIRRAYIGAPVGPPATIGPDPPSSPPGSPMLTTVPTLATVGSSLSASGSASTLADLGSTSLSGTVVITPPEILGMAGDLGACPLQQPEQPPQPSPSPPIAGRGSTGPVTLHDLGSPPPPPFSPDPFAPASHPAALAGSALVAPAAGLPPVVAEPGQDVITLMAKAGPPEDACPRPHQEMLVLEDVASPSSPSPPDTTPSPATTVTSVASIFRPVPVMGWELRGLEQQGQAQGKMVASGSTRNLKVSPRQAVTPIPTPTLPALVPSSPSESTWRHYARLLAAFVFPKVWFVMVASFYFPLSSENVAEIRGPSGDPSPGSRKFVGSHVSIDGSIDQSVQRSVEVTGRSFAIFTKNQRQWRATPLQPNAIRKFKSACEKRGYPPHLILPHAGYLINLASPEDDLRAKSKECLRVELQRCAELGLVKLNVHPGSTKKKMSEEAGLAQVARLINELHADPTTGTVAVVLENTTHGGGTLGRTFEQLAAIIGQVTDKTRIGVCLDTCHLFAAGFDIRTAVGFAQVMRDFDRVVGLRYLMGMHVNDSCGALGSSLDKHANIGKGLFPVWRRSIGLLCFVGKIGLEAFRFIMNSPIFNDIPLILETSGPAKNQVRLLQSLEARPDNEGRAATSTATTSRSRILDDDQ